MDWPQAWNLHMKPTRRSGVSIWYNPSFLLVLVSYPYRFWFTLKVRVAWNLSFHLTKAYGLVLVVLEPFCWNLLSKELECLNDFTWIVGGHCNLILGSEDKGDIKTIRAQFWWIHENKLIDIVP